jgi:hypothetical protein
MMSPGDAIVAQTGQDGALHDQHACAPSLPWQVAPGID